MSRYGRINVRVVAGLVALVLAGGCAVQSRPAPVVTLGQNARAANADPDAPASLPQPPALSTFEARIARVERMVQSQNLVEIISRLDSLQADMAKLKGLSEEQGHNLDNAGTRQQKLYLDLDARLAKLEQAGASQPSVDAAGASTLPPEVPTAVSPAVTPVVSRSNPAQEQAQYEQAFNAMKEGSYDRAITGYKAYLAQFPNGSYADSSRYWLAEAFYATREFTQARDEFKRVAEDTSSRKRPDALLKLGYTYCELENWEQARKVLEDVRSRYPGTTADRLAEKRLKELGAAGH